ncbi:MAG: hypothetical protein JXR75_03250 [Rhodobacteraceae bacterium]|nr:hypothetical protein [Paracoccaceae bacterium]
MSADGRRRSRQCPLNCLDFRQPLQICLDPLVQAQPARQGTLFGLAKVIRAIFGRD